MRNIVIWKQKTCYHLLAVSKNEKNNLFKNADGTLQTYSNQSDNSNVVI